MFGFRIATLLLPALLALPMAAHAHPRYTVTIVGAPGSSASGINSSGTVVGNFPFSDTINHGFVNAAGVITDLLTLEGGDQAYARAVNDSGAIVGQSTNAAGLWRAFRYEAGTMVDLGTLGGDNSRAAGINNRGDIVGTADIPPTEFSRSSRAFLLKPGVTMQDLGRFDVPDNEGPSSAVGINEKRQVVGGSAAGPLIGTEPPFHAFLYACEELRDLGTLGGQYSIANAINERGHIVGEASTPEFRNNRAFLFYRGEMKNLGTLPGGEFSAATDINDKGQIVGGASGPGWERGFLWQSGKMRALNSLISAASGWSISHAAGINNNGQIAGTGCKAGVCYAVRLDPVP